MSFRDYLFSRSRFDITSDVHELNMGLSLRALSGANHELDAIGVSGREVHIFELKHYEASEITKEIVFTFLGKVLDFYLGNVELLSTYRIVMYLVTTKISVDLVVKRLCLTYGIKLIHGSRKTLAVLERLLREMYVKVPDSNGPLKDRVGSLVEEVSELREGVDYSFSDIYRFKEGQLHMEIPSLNTESAIAIVARLNVSFDVVLGEYKARKN